MPLIPNFPSSLLQEHMRWHHANHVNDPSQLPTGYGQNFLQFHRQYITKALQWYVQQGYDPQLVAAWQGVPEVIRRSSCYNQGAEARVLYNPRSFATLDQLGLFIEGSNLHGCIHQEAARAFGEEALNDFDIAPRSTMFYNIHGMIDQWYANWERAQGLARGNRAWSAGKSRGAGSREIPGLRAKRGRIMSLKQAPALPLTNGAAKRGIRLSSKKLDAARNRKP
ncbi:hypothetical protein [Paenibacillus sp. R14(2021)]|uniref:hypothetical protein n=1 Tax=Paenibacillus sp. R14(2021) TaxID=2859228 RepID=UPI001C6135FA|nr:hypothetical protein [Paenibacillus sp. R14(2021)]